jgi:hypothetical protein
MGKQQKYKSEKVFELTTGKLIFFFEVLELWGFLWVFQVLYSNWWGTDSAEEFLNRIGSAFLWVMMPLAVISISKICKVILKFIELRQPSY